MRPCLPALLLALTAFAAACSDDAEDDGNDAEGVSQVEQTCRTAAAAVDDDWGLDPEVAQTQGEDTCAVVSGDDGVSALTLTLLAGRDDVDAALVQACDMFFQTEPRKGRCEKPEPVGAPPARTGRAFLVGDTVVAVNLYAGEAERAERIPDQLDAVEDALTR